MPGILLESFLNLTAAVPARQAWGGSRQNGICSRPQDALAGSAWPADAIPMQRWLGQCTLSRFQGFLVLALAANILVQCNLERD